MNSDTFSYNQLNLRATRIYLIQTEKTAVDLLNLS